jgi:tetratricopeptide (TPR) repeat protein
MFMKLFGRGKPGGNMRIGSLVSVAALALCFSLVSLFSCGAAQEPTIQSAEQELKRGNYQAAITAFNRLLNAKPADAQAQQGLLRAYLETGRYREAEEAAKKFLSGGSQAAPARLSLGEAYAATGRYAEAINEFEQAGKSAPGVARLRGELRRGELLKLTGQEEAAQQIFQSFIRHYNNNNPRTAEELTLVARALVHLEKYKDASELYLDAIEADATFIEAHLGGGELFTSKYNYDDAAKFFGDALQINPNSARAHLGVASNKRIEGGEGMRAALARALEINPNLVEARTLRALTDLEAERFTEAAAALDEALKLNPNALEAHALRAAMFYLQDRAADQEAALKAALAINPRYGEIFETLAHFATNTRRYAQAVEFSRRAMELSPRLWSAHLSLGIGLLRLGQAAEGREAIEVSFKGDPFNVWAKNTLDLLDAMKEYRETVRGAFIIKAAAEQSEALTLYGGELLEEAHRVLSAKYRFTPRAPITIEIFPNHEDFAVRTLGLPGLGALGVCFGQVIAMDSPSARPAGEFNFGSTLWHEYTHVVTLQITEHRIPRWFSEGLSVYEERRARPGWGDDWTPAHLKAFAEGKWFKIADLDAAFLRPRSPEQVPLAYFVASQVCEFIAEKYGFEAILEMLRRYREKGKTPEILQQALQLAEADFDREFEAYVRGKVGPYLRALEGSWKNPNLAQLPKEAVLAMLSAQPEDFALNLRAGTFYKTEGNAEKAAAHLKRAAELFPYYAGPGNAYEQLAQLYEASGNKAAAAEMLEALARVDENNLAALRKAAQWRLELGDKARALEALRLSFYVNPFDAAAHTQAGGLYLESNEPARAVSEFQAALALNPPNLAEAHYNLARAYFASGKTVEAKRAVLRALEAAPGYDKAQELLLKLANR